MPRVPTITTEILQKAIETPGRRVRVGRTNLGVTNVPEPDDRFTYVGINGPLYVFDVMSYDMVIGTIVIDTFMNPQCVSIVAQGYAVSRTTTRHMRSLLEQAAAMSTTGEIMTDKSIQRYYKAVEDPSVQDIVFSRVLGPNRFRTLITTSQKTD